MHKLTKEENCYFINNKRVFQSWHQFKETTIDQVFAFAYAMTFGEGEHRDHRTGGTLHRKRGQIFINTFQGKLSELAVYNTFYQYNQQAYSALSQPDFAVYGLGEWDESDIVLNETKFSIKSTKFYGNLLLLETKDWNHKGEYIPNLYTDKGSIYDYFVLVRIKPDGEKLMRSMQWLYADNIDKEHLYTLIVSEKWEYDIPGYITYEELRFLIDHNFILPQYALLNGKIVMDAENYYVQSGDMRDFRQLVMAL